MADVFRILYVAYRIDPLDPDEGSGADYQFFGSLRRLGHDVQLVGPFEFSGTLPRRILKAVSRNAGCRPPKFWPRDIRHVSSEVRRRIRASRPDLVFTLFFPGLMGIPRGLQGLVRIDTTFRAWQRDGFAGFSRPALSLGLRQERLAFARCSRFITHSEWCANSLTEEYSIKRQRISMFPNPAALPEEALAEGPVRDASAGEQGLLNLLFVGRDPWRKGLDIAIDVVRLLNASGVPARLTVCGVEGQDDYAVKYVGVLKKRLAVELNRYLSLYRSADFLLHPARFDPSPIVTSEAAAFGVPTITNAVGGIPTSVAHGVSGIVLPANSTANTYARTIGEIAGNKGACESLRSSTRSRFEMELNWRVAGGRLQAALDAAVEGSRDDPRVFRSRQGASE